MTQTIKNFMLAGIGGAVAYGIVSAVLTALVTGTIASEPGGVLVLAVVPIVLAAGVVWLIVDTAFK